MKIALSTTFGLCLSTLKLQPPIALYQDPYGKYLLFSTSYVACLGTTGNWQLGDSMSNHRERNIFFFYCEQKGNTSNKYLFKSFFVLFFFTNFLFIFLSFDFEGLTRDLYCNVLLFF